MMRDYGWGAGDTGMGLAGGIIMIAFWIAVLVGIIVLIVWLVRQVQAGPGTTTSTGVTSATPYLTPLDILKTRYAQGEIDQEEYETRRKTLTE